MSNKRIQKTGDRIRNWNNGILELWNDVKEEDSRRHPPAANFAVPRKSISDRCPVIAPRGLVPIKR
jgi:hypothetical protein